MTITLTITPDTPPQMLRLMTTVMHMLTAQEPVPTAEPTFPHEFEFKPLPDTLLTPVDTFKDEWADKSIYTPDLDNEAEVLREMVQGKYPEPNLTDQDQAPVSLNLTGRDEGPVLDAEGLPYLTGRDEGPVLDAEGLPWDQRIHASSKTRNADGTWRQRRGVDPSLVEHVRAELKQTMSAPAPAAPPPPVAPVAPPPPVAPVAPPPPVAPVAPPPPPLQVDNYMSLLTRLSADKASGVVTNVQIDTALEQLGVPTLAALIARPDLVPTLEGMIYDND